MKDQIKAGMILMQEGTFLPDSLLLESVDPTVPNVIRHLYFVEAAI